MRSQSGDSVCDGDANDAVGHPAPLCKRGLCRHGGSVTFVHSVKKNKDIFEVFSLSGSPTNPTILVLQYQTSRQYSDGNPPLLPLTGVSNAGGAGRNNDSEPISGYIWLYLARWLSGRASDLRSSSRGFEARPRRCCVTTLGKLFTPYCLCHQAV